MSDTIFSDRTLEERLAWAEHEMANPQSRTRILADHDAWRDMIAALNKILAIVQSHPMLKDRKSIFAIISCYLKYTDGSDISLTRRQSWAAYLLVWVIAGPSPKGNKSEGGQAFEDPIEAAMKKAKGTIQKYFKRRKGTSPMVVYYHEELDASEISNFEPDCPLFVETLRQQLERIRPRKKRAATEDVDDEHQRKRFKSSSESTSDFSTFSDVSNDISPREVQNIQIQQINYHTINNNYYSYPPKGPITIPQYNCEYSVAGTYNTNQQVYTNYSHLQQKNVPVNYDTSDDTQSNWSHVYNDHQPDESNLYGETFNEPDPDFQEFLHWLTSDCSEAILNNRVEYLQYLYDNMTGGNL